MSELEDTIDAVNRWLIDEIVHTHGADQSQECGACSVEKLIRLALRTSRTCTATMSGFRGADVCDRTDDHRLHEGRYYLWAETLPAVDRVNR
jgi:hypothetical protein